MSEKTVRLGFVGGGFMGQKAHIENFASIPGVELVALAEGRPESAKLVARRFGIGQVFPDHKAMLAGAADKLDAVIAILPYTLHHAVIPDLLRAGKHVLTEKPICVGTQTARQLADLAKKHNCNYMVGYMKRSLPASVYAFDTIQKWKKDGSAGKLTYLRATMNPGDWTWGIEAALSVANDPAVYDGQGPEAFPSWMNKEVADYYNTFVNYYIHQVNLIRYLLGEDYTVTFADKSKALLVAQSVSGATVVLEMLGHGEGGGEWRERYMVGFEKGYVDVGVPAPLARQNGGRVRVHHATALDPSGAGKATTIEPAVTPAGSFREQAIHFVDCIRTGKPNRSPADAAVKDLEVAEQYVKAFYGVK